MGAVAAEQQAAKEKADDCNDSFTKENAQADAPAAEEERVAEGQSDDAARAAEDEFEDEEALSQSAETVDFDGADVQGGGSGQPSSEDKHSRLCSSYSDVSDDVAENSKESVASEGVPKAESSAEGEVFEEESVPPAPAAEPFESDELDRSTTSTTNERIEAIGTDNVESDIEVEPEPAEQPRIVQRNATNGYEDESFESYCDDEEL